VTWGAEKGNRTVNNEISNEPAGSKRIPPEQHALRHFSDKWRVSQEEIQQAIRKVGPLVKDVAHELGKA
jgi:hypothetical protein